MLALLNNAVFYAGGKKQEISGQELMANAAPYCVCFASLCLRRFSKPRLDGLPGFLQDSRGGNHYALYYAVSGVSRVCHRVGQDWIYERDGKGVVDA